MGMTPGLQQRKPDSKMLMIMHALVLEVERRSSLTNGKLDLRVKYRQWDTLSQNRNM